MRSRGRIFRNDILYVSILVRMEQAILGNFRSEIVRDAKSEVGGGEIDTGGEATLRAGHIYLCMTV